MDPHLVRLTGGILVIEILARLILNGVALALLLTATFIVSPYTGFAAAGVIVLFLLKK